MKTKKIDWHKWIGGFVFISLGAATLFLLIAIIVAPAVQDPMQPYERIKSDYVLMFIQCLLGLVAMLLPSAVQKKFKISIPSNMLLLYTIFLYAAIYLGEVKSYYYNVSNWDTILHTFSGGMLGAIGFSFVSLLNEEKEVPMELSPAFVAVFAFCFAMTLGVIWEVYEFSFDGLLGLNMQKFAFESGEPLIGRFALIDTMKDLIVDGVGAFVICVIGYISLKYKKGWIEKFQIGRKA